MLRSDIANLLKGLGWYIAASEVDRNACEHMIAFLDYILEKQGVYVAKDR